MRTVLSLVAASALVAFAAVSASAKTDAKSAAKKDPAHPRWAHSYEAALAEAKARGCVVFVTLHAEH